MGLFDRFRKKESTQEETYTPTLDEQYEKAMEEADEQYQKNVKEAEDQIADIEGRLRAMDNAPGARRANDMAREYAQQLAKELNLDTKPTPAPKEPEKRSNETGIYNYYVCVFNNTFLTKEQFLNPQTKEQLLEKKRLLQEYDEFMRRINHQEEPHRTK